MQKDFTGDILHPKRRENKETGLQLTCRAVEMVISSSVDIN